MGARGKAIESDAVGQRPWRPVPVREGCSYGRSSPDGGTDFAFCSIDLAYSESRFPGTGTLYPRALEEEASGYVTIAGTSMMS